MRAAHFPTPAITSRLPGVSTTIFSIMSALAAEHGAVNLGQGFPDFDCDPKLMEAVTCAMQAGYHQYSPMPGWWPLRQAIAEKTAALYGRSYDADTEITVTAGATQALLTVILAIVQPGDEVIVLEPCYDSYVPAITLAGGHVVRVPLSPHSLSPDMQRIAAAITPRTRALILNTPHNPGSGVWSAAQMQELADILAPTNVILIADEVYEHMVYDGARHESAARHASLAARAFVVSSFGKTFHVTGWKVGSVMAPAALMDEFRKIHQFNVFSVNTPMQAALAHYLADPTPWQQLSAFYQRKRDLFAQGLRTRTRLRPLPCAGTYFQCVDISELTAGPGACAGMDEAAFCQWLARDIGVAAIPLSAFYGDGFDQGIVRLCFAKRDDTLHAALQRLARI